MLNKGPSCEDLRQWLNEKQAMVDACRPIKLRNGRAWLMDDMLTEDQEAAFLQSLDRPPPGSTLYKLGKRSFVGACPIADTELAMKYYLPLGIRRQLGYTILGTRCMRSWISNRALSFVGIRTPRPVGIAELIGFGGISERSVLATEVCEGLMLPDFLEDHSHDEALMKVIAEGCQKIFSTLARYRIYHRDTNPRNFIVEPDHRISVIDLDAVSLLVHPKLWPAKRKKDVRKFSVIFNKYPHLKPIFKGIFDERVEDSPNI